MDAYEYYLLGKISLENGDYLSAINFLNISNEIDAHFKTYERLYLCYLQLNDIENAINAISTSYNLNSHNDKTAFEYAEALINYKKDYVTSKKILEGIIQRNSTYKAAKNLLDKMKTD